MGYAIFTLIIVDIVAILILHPLLYKPMCGNWHDRQDPNPWQQYWGESYGQELKQRLLKPVFGALETEGKIGDLIIDIGSGASPVTQLLKTKSTRKRICVDIAADNTGLLDDLRIRLDAEKVGQFEALSFRKAILRVCALLDIDPKTEAKIERADTIVVSDTLNYVDFRKVLNGFANYLKPNGRIIVLNLPWRGNRLLFSDKGLKDNRQLYAFLEEHHFEIEHKAFPKRPRNETDESEELIVLVARKCVQT
jgi:SAM-dependent methyltransferase